MFGQDGQTAQADRSRLYVHLSSDNLFTDKELYDISSPGTDTYTVTLEPGIGFGVSYFRARKNNTFYRLGLLDLSIGQHRGTRVLERTANSSLIVEGNDQSFSRITTQAEIGRYFLRGNVRLGASVFARPTYQYFRSAPKVPELFPVDIHDLDLSVGIIPAVEFNVTPNLIIAGQVPVSIGHFRYLSIHADDPFLPEDERRTSSFTTDFDLRVGLQIGLMANI